MTVDELSGKLDEALAKATELKDEQSAIKALVDGLKVSVADLTAQVADLQSQIGSGQPVDLQPLADKLAVIQSTLDDSDSVADSVLAGTPSDPNSEE